MNYIIDSHRIMLRTFSDKDIEEFYNYRNDSIIAKYQSWEYPYSKEKAERFVNEHKQKSLDQHNHGWMQIAIERKIDKSLIGDCAINFFDDRKQAEFGITIRKEYQEKGFGYEVLRILFNNLFSDQKIHRIIGLTDKENLGSIKLMKKIGMRLEGKFIKSYYDLRLKEWRDEHLFAIIESEWFNKPV